MRIAVLGSTGATGRQVLAVALRRGHEVIALARTPEALADLEQPGLRVRPADVTVPETVTLACDGADAVISALGISKGGPADTLTSGAHAVADAKPPRIAWMGSLGGGASRGRAGMLYDVILRRVLGEDGFADKGAADEIVGGPNTTVFHPVMLTGRPATNAAHVVPLDELTRKYRLMPSRVSRADVAASMVAEVENPAYPGRTVAVY